MQSKDPPERNTTDKKGNRHDLQQPDVPISADGSNVPYTSDGLQPFQSSLYDRSNFGYIDQARMIPPVNGYYNGSNGVVVNPNNLSAEELSVSLFSNNVFQPVNMLGGFSDYSMGGYYDRVDNTTRCVPDHGNTLHNTNHLSSNVNSSTKPSYLNVTRSAITSNRGNNSNSVASPRFDGVMEYHPNFTGLDTMSMASSMNNNTSPYLHGMDGTAGLGFDADLFSILPSSSSPVHNQMYNNMHYAISNNNGSNKNNTTNNNPILSNIMYNNTNNSMGSLFPYTNNNNPHNNMTHTEEYIVSTSNHPKNTNNTSTNTMFELVPLSTSKITPFRLTPLLCAVAIHAFYLAAKLVLPANNSPKAISSLAHIAKPFINTLNSFPLKHTKTSSCNQPPVITYTRSYPVLPVFYQRFLAFSHHFKTLRNTLLKEHEDYVHNNSGNNSQCDICHTKTHPIRQKDQKYFSKCVAKECVTEYPEFLGKFVSTCISMKPAWDAIHKWEVADALVSNFERGMVKPHEKESVLQDQDIYISFQLTQDHGTDMLENKELFILPSIPKLTTSALKCADYVSKKKPNSTSNNAKYTENSSNGSQSTTHGVIQRPQNAPMRVNSMLSTTSTKNAEKAKSSSSVNVPKEYISNKERMKLANNLHSIRSEASKDAPGGKISRTNTSNTINTVSRTNTNNNNTISRTNTSNSISRTNTGNNTCNSNNNNSNNTLSRTNTGNTINCRMNSLVDDKVQTNNTSISTTTTTTTTSSPASKTTNTEETNRDQNAQIGSNNTPTSNIGSSTAVLPPPCTNTNTTNNNNTKSNGKKKETLLSNNSNSNSVHIADIAAAKVISQVSVIVKTPTEPLSPVTTSTSVTGTEPVQDPALLSTQTDIHHFHNWNILRNWNAMCRTIAPTIGNMNLLLLLLCILPCLQPFFTYMLTLATPLQSFLLLTKHTFTQSPFSLFGLTTLGNMVRVQPKNNICLPVSYPFAYPENSKLTYVHPGVEYHTGMLRGDEQLSNHTITLEDLIHHDNNAQYVQNSLENALYNPQTRKTESTEGHNNNNNNNKLIRQPYLKYTHNNGRKNHILLQHQIHKQCPTHQRSWCSPRNAQRYAFTSLYNVTDGKHADASPKHIGVWSVSEYIDTLANVLRQLEDLLHNEQDSLMHNNDMMAITIDIRKKMKARSDKEVAQTLDSSLSSVVKLRSAAATLLSLGELVEKNTCDGLLPSKTVGKYREKRPMYDYNTFITPEGMLLPSTIVDINNAMQLLVENRRKTWLYHQRAMNLESHNLDSSLIDADVVVALLLADKFAEAKINMANFTFEEFDKQIDLNEPPLSDQLQVGLLSDPMQIITSINQYQEDQKSNSDKVTVITNNQRSSTQVHNIANAVQINATVPISEFLLGLESANLQSYHISAYAHGKLSKSLRSRVEKALVYTITKALLHTSDAWKVLSSSSKRISLSHQWCSLGPDARLFLRSVFQLLANMPIMFSKGLYQLATHSRVSSIGQDEGKAVKSKNNGKGDENMLLAYTNNVTPWHSALVSRPSRSVWCQLYAQSDIFNYLCKDADMVNVYNQHHNILALSHSNLYLSAEPPVKLHQPLLQTLTPSLAPSKIPAFSQEPVLEALQQLRGRLNVYPQAGTVDANGYTYAYFSWLNSLVDVAFQPSPHPTLSRQLFRTVSVGVTFVTSSISRPVHIPDLSLTTHQQSVFANSTVLYQPHTLSKIFKFFYPPETSPTKVQSRRVGLPSYDSKTQDTVDNSILTLTPPLYTMNAMSVIFPTPFNAKQGELDPVTPNYNWDIPWIVSFAVLFYLLLWCIQPTSVTDFTVSLPMNIGGRTNVRPAVFVSPCRKITIFLLHWVSKFSSVRPSLQFFSNMVFRCSLQTLLNRNVYSAYKLRCQATTLYQSYSVITHTGESVLLLDNEEFSDDESLWLTLRPPQSKSPITQLVYCVFTLLDLIYVSSIVTGLISDWISMGFVNRLFATVLAVYLIYQKYIQQYSYIQLANNTKLNGQTLQCNTKVKVT